MRGAARFAAIDTDGDGALSRAELATRGDARAARRLDRIMARDADGDGRLTRAELTDGSSRDGRGGRVFERADADGDGALSRTEWDEMAQRRGRR